MNSAELLRMAFLNLKRRKARTFLAVMGVIIGTCAIVVMLSLGIGLKQSYEEQIKSMGNIHMIHIHSQQGRGGLTDTSDKDKGKLDDKGISKIRKLEGVKALTPIDQYFGKISIGKYVTDIGIMGVDPAAMEQFGLNLQQGRMLKTSDKNALLFGSEIPYWFWDPRTEMSAPMDANGKPQLNLISDKLIYTRDEDYMRGKRRNEGGAEGSQAEKPKYELHKMKGVGVLEETNNRFSYSVFTSLDTLKKLKQSAERAEKAVGQRRGYGFEEDSKNGYQEAILYAESIDHVEAIVNILKDWGYMPESQIDTVNKLKKTANLMQAVLGGIGAVSLLVAALGIANTMIMSIYERTREIGVMKVIGAKLKDIKNLFLLEAGLIGFFGGMVGNLLSLFVSFLVNTFLPKYGMENNLGGGISEMNNMINMGEMVGADGNMSKISIIPWWLLLASLAFAVAIGIVSGYYPAKRAMNLSALESLRNE